MSEIHRHCKGCGVSISSLLTRCKRCENGWAPAIPHCTHCAAEFAAGREEIERLTAELQAAKQAGFNGWHLDGEEIKRLKGQLNAVQAAREAEAALKTDARQELAAAREQVGRLHTLNAKLRKNGGRDEIARLNECIDAAAMTAALVSREMESLAGKLIAQSGEIKRVTEEKVALKVALHGRIEDLEKDVAAVTKHWRQEASERDLARDQANGLSRENAELRACLDSAGRQLDARGHVRVWPDADCPPSPISISRARLRELLPRVDRLALSHGEELTWVATKQLRKWAANMGTLRRDLGLDGKAWQEELVGFWPMWEGTIAENALSAAGLDGEPVTMPDDCRGLGDGPDFQITIDMARPGTTDWSVDQVLYKGEPMSGAWLTQVLDARYEDLRIARAEASKLRRKLARVRKLLPNPTRLEAILSRAAHAFRNQECGWLVDTSRNLARLYRLLNPEKKA